MKRGRRVAPPWHGHLLKGRSLKAIIFAKAKWSREIPAWSFKIPVTPPISSFLLKSCQVPCFPSKKTKVVQPEEVVQYKHVHRYGETNVRHVGQTLAKGQWKKGGVTDPNAGRPLPETPRRAPAKQKVIQHEDQDREIRQQEQVQRRAPPRETHREEAVVQRKPPRPRHSQPLSTDFYISVPIFTETFSHSYRKKNEFVYFDGDDEMSLYHQSLSRASSIRELNDRESLRGSLHRDNVNLNSSISSSVREGSARRVPSNGQRDLYREKKRARSLQRHPPQSQRRRRPMSGSEASYNTYSSRGTYGYESETFEEAKMMRSGPRSGLSVDSDDDYR